MKLSAARFSHVVNATYEITNRAGRNLGYAYTKRLIQDALQWRYVTQSGIQAQLPGFGILSPYTTAVIAPAPITPPAIQPVISPEPVFPVVVPGLIPVGPPAKIMGARFLSILNKWMDHFLKSQRYTIRPKYVWYIPRNMMERFVKEIGAASNREGGKYGYSYEKGLIWDALQRRGYEPDKEASGAKRNPYDKQVQTSPYDTPGSAVPASGRQTIPPMITPPDEIPVIPPPPVPTPPDEREETYSERIKRRLREAREKQEAIEREKRKAEEHRAAVEREKRREPDSERERKIRRYKERMKREAEWAREALLARMRERAQRGPLPTLTPDQRVKYLKILNRAIDNRLRVAKWPTLPGKIISIPDVDYEKLIASVQTFANMMAATIRETYHRFSSGEVGHALASKGYVRGNNARPASGTGSSPLPARVVNFDDYKELLNTVSQKIPKAHLPRLVMGPERQKPIHQQYIIPLPSNINKGCATSLEKGIRQALGVRKAFDHLESRMLSWVESPVQELFISPKAHADLVKAALISSKRGYYWQYKCTFTESDVRDIFIARGYIPHPQGTNTPMMAKNIGPSTAAWGQRGQAIYPWEVDTKPAPHVRVTPYFPA